jgi:tetratricopeptide (TPR) repeat protein
MAEIFWNLKDKKGRIFGPFTTAKIIELIERGILDGEEFITPSTSERWVQVSKYPEFYDVIIDMLSKENKKLSSEEISKELSLSQNFQGPAQPSPPPKRGRAVIEEDTRKKNDQKKKLAESFSAPPPEPKKKKEKRAAGAIIELKEENNFLSQEKKKYAVILAIVLAALFAIGYLFYDELFESAPIGQEKIHLLFPSQKKGELSLSETQEMYKHARTEFQKDNFVGYYHSLQTLVEILESNPKNRDALSLLCLTYRELWPYTYQDSSDLQNLTKLVQMAQNEDSLGVHGATCRAVQASLTSDNAGLNSVLQTLLNDYPTAAVLYEMKALILYSQNQVSEAIAYVQKTESLWPQWVKSFFLEAQMRVAIQDYYNAAKILKNILDRDPKHSKSMVQLGILELTQFHNAKGMDRIMLGLEDPKLSTDVRVSAYVALTTYYVSTQPKTALDYAQKAFALDPRNTFLRNTILTLGGEAALLKVKSEDTQLVILGDSYLKNKNYLAAQAEYKTAFETNPKNATAAIKASQSLWGLNQTKEAIDWGIKAIKADPKMVEAYVQLADYYSQKFDFKAASDMLTKARAETKTNYQILRAYAQVELRRKSPKTATKYAEDALKLYDSDVESLDILAEAYMAQNQYEKAYQYATKATSLDSNNAHSQEVYGLALSGMRGSPAAQEYMSNLINTYPNNLDFRISLGKILIKDEKYNEAIPILQQVVASDAGQMRALMLLGDAYLQTNQLNDALKTYIKAASLDPSGAEPLFKIGQAYLRNKDTVQKAMTHFQRVTEINPRYPEAYYYAGKAALLLGLTSQAEQYAEMEKRVNPGIAAPYILLSDIHISKNQYIQAANDLRLAVKIRPDDANLYIQLAKCYRLSGQLDVAASMLRLATAKESGNADIYREQGAVFDRQGLGEQALAAYTRYLELKPNADDKAEVKSRIIQLGGTP